MACWTLRIFVISSNLTTTNTRSVGFVPAVPIRSSLSLGSSARNANGSRKGHLLCVASKPGWAISSKWFLAVTTLGGGHKCVMPDPVEGEVIGAP